MSTAKELLFDEEARSKLRDGIDKLAEVVSITLGPKGRSVGLQASWGTPTITSDGNQVAKDFELKDAFENMGVSLAKEVASKMKEKCGDGTTTSLLLLHALVKNGMKNIASGASPIAVKRGIDKAVEAILAQLEKLAIAIQTPSEVQGIATASAGGDAEIGSTIAETLQKVTLSGVVTIEKGKSTKTTVEMVDGMQFDRGYISAYFSTGDDMKTQFSGKPRVLVTDKKITSVQEILPILQEAAATATELLLIAEDFESDALSTLVVNKLRGTLKVCAVKAPGFGDRRKALLEDIAILCGATPIFEERGLFLKNATLELLGSAEKIVITKETTTIVGGRGQPEAIRARVKIIEAEIEKTTSSYDKEKLDERKAKLSGGVAVIRVGAATEPEANHKEQRYQDSLNSTRAALEEGIVVGGGIALLRASKAVVLNLAGEEAIGAQIVLKACEAPFRQIVTNTGFDSSVLLGEVLAAPAYFGFNALSEKVEDLVAAGVVNPAKVDKNALRFAASTAGVILLSEALISNASEDDESK